MAGALALSVLCKTFCPLQPGEKTGRMVKLFHRGVDMLEVRNLVKNYGKQAAVKNISFTLQSGRVYGLLGPNGAGKSTTMNIITGYLGASSGTVIVEGHDLYAEPEEARRCIGYLPEIPPLYEEMTVLEYLQTAAELKGISPARLKDELKRVMEEVKLTDRRDTLVRLLSKGYRQRVGIAQALIGDPQIIILDEPTVGLDPIQVQQFRSLIRRLGEHHTVILSSHILQEISAVCDEILILKKGEIIAEGSAAELENLARGGSRLELLAEGSREEIGECLSAVPGIHSFRMREEEKEPGTVRVVLEAEAGADIRRDLFFGFSERKLPILEMSPVMRSLETAFLELTQEPGIKETSFVPER